ncbi:hypothetical protein CAPTEDRAFT_229252 [Capitella teleta]|uniref:hypoxia-inducible factor-proline dioxygenase n=1 Tax=Capitella teleta TaxID=283909 RepID=R7TXX2_CAPTE|nr:hypothetical protein CAPTEDRAFT_229252 [Capitella teleta]|eukprot:ELT98594.1 hypothetical protein CAPTEDRAFT_229252 [Capitella teleta]
MADCGLRAEWCRGEKCPACELCGAIEKLSLCGACRQTWYCCREHQKSHWRQHKKECKSNKRPGCETSQSQRRALDSESPTPKRQSPKQGKSGKVKKEPITEKTPEKKEETKLVDYVTKCLQDYGMCVVDNFLGPEKGNRILQEVVDLSEAGQFQDGQISSATLPHTQMQKVRGDKITWVEKGTADCDYIGYLIERLDRLMKASNGKLASREINGRTKAMVACYPGDGTGYMQHVDNPNQDGRCITCIYYLNKDWDVSKHGGLLRIHPSQLPSIAVADIEPKFDRLLFFWSDRRNPHEVQPAFRRRFAITVWYFDAEERRQARKRHEIIGAIAKAKKQAMAPSSSATRPSDD